MEMTNTNIQNEATIKQTFKSKLLSFNNGELNVNFTYDTHLAIDRFYEMIILCQGIPSKPLYEQLNVINNSPELIARAFKTIVILRTEFQQVRMLFDETIQK